MAEETNEAPKEAFKKGEAAAGKKGMMKLVLLAGAALLVVCVSATAAAVVSKMMNPSPAAVEQKEADAGHGQSGDSHGSAAAKDVEGDFKYFEFEPIIANLNEPRLQRYARASVALAIKKEDFSKAEEAIKARKPELKNWINTFLAGCTPDDVRGPGSLKRIQRNIEEEFNTILWRDGKPLIHHVLFEVVIQ